MLNELLSNPIPPVNLTGLTGSVATTTLFTMPSNNNGMCLVAYDLVTTTAGTAGNVSVNFNWLPVAGLTVATTGATLALSTLGAEASGVFALSTAAGQPVTFSTTVSSATGSPVYSLRVRIIYLG